MVSELKEIKILAKPVTYVSMVSELKEIKSLAKPVTYVSVVGKLKRNIIFSKAGVQCVYGQKYQI